MLDQCSDYRIVQISIDAPSQRALTILVPAERLAPALCALPFGGPASPASSRHRRMLIPIGVRPPSTAAGVWPSRPGACMPRSRLVCASRKGDGWRTGFLGRALADGGGRMKWLLTSGGGFGVCDGREAAADVVASSGEVAARFGWPELLPW